MSTKFHDTAEIKISAEDFNKMAVGEYVSTPKRDIVGSKDIQWAFRVVQGGDKHADIFLWTSKSVLKAYGVAHVGPADARDMGFNINVDDTTNLWHINYFWPSRLGVNGVVTMDVTFTNFEKKDFSAPLTIHDFVADSSHYVPNAQLVVGDKTIPTHRHLLCMISPVFQAAFTHDTKEARTGTLTITDFDFETVKRAIDYCYGRVHATTELHQFVDILMFADKYDIKALIKKVEPLLLHSEVTQENFGTIAKYAWDLDKTDLKSKCVKYYRNNVGTITLTPEFVGLDPSTQVDIIRSAACLS